MQGVGRIVLAGIVHEVEDHQALLAIIQPHATTQLLGIQHLGHGGPGHEQYLDLRAVPALVQQIAGTQYLDLPVHELFLEFHPLRLLHAAGNRSGLDALIPEHFRNLLGVLDGSAEHHRPLVPDILQPGFHDQFIPLRNIDLALQIPDVVLDTVEAHLGQVDVGVDTNAPHRHQLADLHGGLDVQLVGGVLENIQNTLVIRPFRSGRQTQRKAGLEIGQHLLVCISRRVVGLVHDEIVKIVILEVLQMEGNTLHTAADHMGTGLLDHIAIAAHGGVDPQLPEPLGSLIYQLLGVGDEQHTTAAPLGIQHGGGGLSGAGSVVQQRNGLAVITHGLQCLQCRLLMLLQLQIGAVQSLGLLGRQVVLDLLELGMVTQEHTKLVLDLFGILLQLPHRPTVHIPAQMHHAVLFQQIVIELTRSHQLLVVGALVINLNGHTTRTIFQHKVGITAVLVDVVEVILGVEVSCLLCAKGIGKQVYKQILRRTAGCGMILGHGGHLSYK